ncbi:MAG: hypothetical protein JNN20_08840 [Betaproteobacteria bacterium]|nr:hypothetical protein [Betaproteobacteria bacterium]
MSAAMNTQAFEPFWVEQLDRHGAVMSRQRVHDGALTVGRGYDNDLIIDDPYIAPAHLRIGYDGDGALWIEDLVANAPAGSDSPASSTRMLVGSEASIRIGQTTLRVRTRAFAVPPALAMAAPPATSFLGSDGGRLLICAAVVMLMSLLSAWFKQTGEFKVATYLAAGVFLPLGILAWAGVWSLITRIVASHAHFLRHALIVFAFLLGIELIDDATDFVAYALTWKLPSLIAQSAATVLMGALIFAHLSVVVPRRKRIAGTIIGVLVAIGIGASIAERFDTDRPQPQRIVAKLLPPFLQLKQPGTPEKFFKDVDALKAKLDEARKKEPSSSVALFDDDE